jgi:hypothetical protein
LPKIRRGKKCLRSIQSRRLRLGQLRLRLAAKFLFLNRLETASTGGKDNAKPTLVRLSSEVLDLYSPWMYQKVEVLPVAEKPGPHLGLFWCGQKRGESISLSHTDNMSCACLTFGDRTTIDIESAVPRVSSFYKNSFTSAEKAWVSHCVGDDPARSNWLFTLLWTLKESASKLEAVSPASVWNLPQIEIEDLPDLRNVVSFTSENTVGGDFFPFMARVRERHTVTPVQVAVTSTRNLIVSVMQPRRGVSN